MASRRISTRNGFSIIELTVTIGIFATLAGLSLFLGMDSYHSYSFRSERDTVVSILQKARAEAMSNTGGKPHGVCFEDNAYIIFEGDSCATASKKISIPASNSVAITWPSDVVFAQLSGNSAQVTIHLLEINTSKSYDIVINNEGRID